MKLPECDRCQLNAHSIYFICTLHPEGIESETCPDHEPKPEEEQWEPVGANYYNGELILQPHSITPERQMALIDWHPIFTGKCPRCSAEFDRDYVSRVHWDCLECGWMDDTA